MADCRDEVSLNERKDRLKILWFYDRYSKMGESMTEKIAILSNVNMNFVIRGLKNQVDVFEAEGYGNELGTLLNPRSSYHAIAPRFLFLLMDLMQLLDGVADDREAEEKIERWFTTLSDGLGEEICYVSDAYLWSAEEQGESGQSHGAVDTAAELWLTKKNAWENLWQKRLETFVEKYPNARIFSYKKIVEQLGEEKAFSALTWRMGKIPHSSVMQKALAEEILHRVDVETRVPKKVLLLDLDNTLWGGLAGEHESTPIVLGGEGQGAAYLKMQEIILDMQKQGVVLGIVSKNNVQDAVEIIEKHPEMILRAEHFSAKKINWNLKSENILEIARELNLGLDSFVFFDDNPAERALVQEMLPQVTVPEFPEAPEDLPRAMTAIYRAYFEKPYVTKEDTERTRQYAENAKRLELQQSAVNFESYLKDLEIVAERVDAKDHMERLLQLVNKTNQFNLTTVRYTAEELQELVSDDAHKVHLYRVEDKFGDNGIVAVLIVKLEGQEAVIEEFTMSCRVMGRNIEHAIMDAVEQELRRSGVKTLKGSYIPTAKNAPVAELYPALGFECCGSIPCRDGHIYRRDITDGLQRVDHVAWKGEQV